MSAALAGCAASFPALVLLRHHFHRFFAHSAESIFGRCVAPFFETDMIVDTGRIASH